MNTCKWKKKVAFFKVKKNIGNKCQMINECENGSFIIYLDSENENENWIHYF